MKPKELFFEIVFRSVFRNENEKFLKCDFFLFLMIRLLQLKKDVIAAENIENLTKANIEDGVGKLNSMLVRCFLIKLI